MLSRLFTYFAYAIAIISAGTGIAVLAGMLFPSYIPTQVRSIFGVVLILLGIYRASVTYVRGRQSERQPYESPRKPSAF